MAKSGKKSKVIVIDKKEIEKAANEMKAKLKEMGEAGEDSASKIKKSFDKASKDIVAAIEAASSKTTTTFIQGMDGVQKSIIAQKKPTEDVRTEVEKLDKSYDNLNKETQKTVETNDALSGSWTKMLGIIGGTTALKMFVSKITDVRAEFEMLDKSFEVLLGSRKKAEGFVSEIIQYAIDTPFSTSNISGAAQTLLGFNVEAEKVMPTLKQIGDISMGNAQRFDSLSLAFAQMSAAGRLLGQDLNQMINAGFNPLQVISEQTGKSIANLKSEMEKGGISSEMVAKAFEDATAEGGKFHGMLSKNADSINTLKNQLTGAFEEMYNQLGEASEETIKGFYKTGIAFAKNYKKIGKILTVLIATFGAYRAALALATATSRGYTIAELAKLKALVAVEKAQKLLNATMLKNPYVLLTTVAVGLVTTLWALHDSTSAADKAQKSFNEKQEKSKEIIEGEIGKINSLIDAIKDETKSRFERVKAFNLLQQTYPDIFGKYRTEIELLNDIANVQQKIVDKQVGMHRAANELKFEEADKKWMDALKRGSVKTDEYFIEREKYRSLVYQDTQDAFYSSLSKMDDKALDEWIDKIKTSLPKNKEAFFKLEIGTHDGYNKEIQVNTQMANSIIDRINAEKESRSAEKESIGLIREKEKALEALEAKYGAVEDIKDKATLKAYNQEKSKLEQEIKDLKDFGVDKSEKKQETKTLSFDDEYAKRSYALRKESLKNKQDILKLEEEYEIDSINKIAKENLFTEEETQKLIETTRQIYAQRRSDIQNEESQKEQEQIEKSLEAFKNYQTRKKEIEDRYAELRANAKGEDGYDVSLIDKSEKEEIDKLNSEFYPQAKETAIDLTRASTRQLKEELKGLRERLKNATNPQEVEALQNRIDKTLNTLENKTPFSIFTSNLKEATKGGKVDFELLGGAINGLIPELQGIANDSRALFGDGAGDFMDGLTEAIGGVADLATSIGSFASGDIAGGIAGLLSAGNKFFGNAIKVNAEHREALRLLKLQREQLEHQYKIQELLKKLENSKSVFGSDAWGQSRRSAEVYATSIKDLEGSIRKLQDVEVVTGSRKSGWGPWKKRKDVWTPILEAYPKLIKSSGEFDKTLAENILSTQKLSDEGKFALQSAIDNADALEQAYAQMSDNLSAVFGNLGATIMDTFSEAFKSGKDGFADMFDSAGDMLEQFTKQMIYSVTLQPIMEEASKQMMDIQSSSKSDTAKLDMMMEIISNTINDAKNQEDRVNELLGYAKEQADKQGLDILNDSKKQQSSVGVTKTASQDSIDVMDGRLTHVQETNQGILNSSQEIAVSTKVGFSTLSEQINTANRISLANMYQIADIVKNTNELYAIKDAVQRIDKNTKGL